MGELSAPIIHVPKMKMKDITISNITSLAAYKEAKINQSVEVLVDLKHDESVDKKLFGHIKFDTMKLIYVTDHMELSEKLHSMNDKSWYQSYTDYSLSIIDAETIREHAMYEKVKEESPETRMIIPPEPCGDFKKFDTEVVELIVAPLQFAWRVSMKGQLNQLHTYSFHLEDLYELWNQVK